MNCRAIRLTLFLSLLLVVSWETPAPLVYREGIGWTYEPAGGGKWVRTRAKDQLEAAREAFDQKDFATAAKAARRTVSVWPFSDYAPEAQYVLGRAFEEQKKDQKAFKAYQDLLTKYPKTANYEEVLKRQFLIANRYLAGQWFRKWGLIPYRSVEETVKLYEGIVKTGPYSEVAPQAQISVGTAWEKKKVDQNMALRSAVKAYEAAADRYHYNKKVASDALFKAGLAYHRQAKKAEYDQSVAGQAIATFTDFMILYPEDPRIPEAQQIIAELKTEQARGSMMVARFYEKKNMIAGAEVYYNEAVSRDPNSPYAEEARRRLEELKKKKAPQTAQQ